MENVRGIPTWGDGTEFRNTELGKMGVIKNGGIDGDGYRLHSNRFNDIKRSYARAVLCQWKYPIF